MKMSETVLDNFLNDLPDAIGAERFFNQFAERNSFQANKLLKNEGLLSDVLTLTAFSPLFATTLLQHPEYVAWLGKHRKESNVRDKEELLESLARFSMTNSQVEPTELLARFRRRELLRIYLRDIRRLGTIAEVTEEISHLADAILEYALRLARQELDNRFGNPLELDEKGRAKPAKFCVVALGKLGSKELNYSSDIDLLFLYSTDGNTSGSGSRGVTSNREYFIKLSEFIVKLVGHEGGAYRVDLRLRPHGRVGALAISLKEAINYYQTNAQAWERQTLIRSRACAGDAEVFRTFFEAVENYVFSADETVENALNNVRLSKEKINREHTTNQGFNVKLGTGGIREIEFIAQALQLAHGGRDQWLRAPHTLISLSRLADRNLLSENELTQLADAYEFLRRLEHRLQMENGLQTHIVPDEAEKRLLIAKRMNCQNLSDFDENLHSHTQKVNGIFQRVFGNQPFKKNNLRQSELLKSIEKSAESIHLTEEKAEHLSDFTQLSPYFSEMLTANPALLQTLPKFEDEFVEKNYDEIFRHELGKTENFAQELAILRKTWSKFLLEIAFFDIFGKITGRESKTSQTRLAEASLTVAYEITKRELQARYGKFDELHLAVLGLGKLGGRGMDYGSDLDLILVYDDEKPLPFPNLTHVEFYAKATEILVTILSSFTREGNLYRVDLRLRPDGKNGATCLGKSAFLSYFQNRSAMWEWLAYVKIRGVAGDVNLALETEKQIRQILHKQAQTADIDEFRKETLRVRERLETERSDIRSKKEVNIKFGAGGMLDVYFAMRFLQLRDNVPDDAENRSSLFMLEKLAEKGSLKAENFKMFYEGYDFLSQLDHALRLTFGRSAVLPNNLEAISKRLKTNNLLEILTFHRLSIRTAYENILQK
jgi:[glutamine synthetase] adenylyltransferase / [glutamine synthetase]-adenylyl-L-tyrosine phosphorylase